MKRTLTIFIIVAAVMVGTVPAISGAEPASKTNPDYFVLKGGYYYPSQILELNEFNDTDFERRSGFNGELAWGHYLVPFFGIEFGVGYFENKRFPGTGTGDAKIESIPVLLSGKFFLPLGPIEPYIEGGYGAYFTRFKSESAFGELVDREIASGPHAGVGVNINFTDSMYLGVEGRYRWVKDDFNNNQDVRLDGYTATANLGFRF